MAEAGGAEPGKPPPVASLERALDQVCDFLGRAEQSARVRALVIEARRLRNAVGNWRSITPDADVREEMIARVLRLANDAEDVVAAERPPSETPEEAGSGAGVSPHDTPTAVYQKRTLAIGLRLGPVQASAAQPVASLPPKKNPPPGAAMFLAGLAGGQEGQAAPTGPLDGNGRRSAPDGRAVPELATTVPGRPPAGAGVAPIPTIDLGATVSTGLAMTVVKASPGLQRGSLTRDQALQLDRVVAPPGRDVGVQEAHAQQAAAKPNESALAATFVSPPSLVFDRSALPQLNAQPPQPQPQPQPAARPFERTYASPPSLVFDRVVPPPAQNHVADVKPPQRAEEATFEEPPSLHIGQMNRPPEDSSGPTSDFGSSVYPDAISVRSLPPPEALDPRFVMVRDPYSPQADAYRTLRRKLSTITATTIAVTSALPREGKTTCAINLALALRETIRGRILIVDANIRSPGIATTLQFDPPLCFTEQLQRHRDDRLAPWIVVEQAAPSVAAQPGKEGVETTSDRNNPSAFKSPEARPSILAPIHVLAINPRAERPPMIDAVAFSMGMESLKRAGYAYIILDTPPVLGSMDMNVIGDSVDGVLLTSLIKKSTRGSLRQAIERLRPAPVLGVVLLDY